MGCGVRGVAAHLGFKESSAVVPDLSCLPAVGRDAHGCGPCVSNVASDRQILILGPVLYPDVHCRLGQGEAAIYKKDLGIWKSGSKEGRLRQGVRGSSLCSFTLPPFSQYV